MELFTIFAKTCTTSFLGLRPWYYYLQLDKNCDIQKLNSLSQLEKGIPLILLAIVDDLLRIAGIVAVAYVIVGAVGFIGSEGNPENAAKARSTVINALIGLAIASVAIAFVSFIGHRVG